MTDHLAVLEELAKVVAEMRDRRSANERCIEGWAARVDAAIALMRGQSWQPIETAPRDGSGIFAWWGSDSKPFGIRSFGVTLFRNGEWRDPDDEDETYGEPTHWQPLDPPKDPADEQ